MGIFDVTINKQLETNKDQLIESLKKKLSPLSEESKIDKSTLFFKSFKAEGTLLTYDLNIEIDASKKSLNLNIFGELLNVWIMIVIIVLGILFTYGIGVILLVLFVFYQKRVTRKYL
jgi:hypothetical protein